MIDALSGLKGFELVDARCGVAVIFGRRHDAIFPVPGVKDGDADDQGGGEVPAMGVGDLPRVCSSIGVQGDFGCAAPRWGRSSNRRGYLPIGKHARRRVALRCLPSSP